MIATQQAEIVNKIKFGADYNAKGEDVETKDIISSIDEEGLRDS